MHISESDVMELLSDTDMTSNFKNVNKDLFNLAVVFNCEKYKENYCFYDRTCGNYCDEVSMLVNSKIQLYLSAMDVVSFPKNSNDYDGPEVYLVNNYLISIDDYTGIDLYLIKIYNLNGDILYENEYVISMYSTNYTKWRKEVCPIVIDNILHFVEESDFSNPYIDYNYYTIDLSSNKIEPKLISTIHENTE